MKKRRTIRTYYSYPDDIYLLMKIFLITAWFIIVVLPIIIVIMQIILES